MVFRKWSMTEQSGVDFIEEWQTGAFLLVLSVIVGAVLVIGLGSVLPSSPVAILSIFFVGAISRFSERMVRLLQRGIYGLVVLHPSSESVTAVLTESGSSFSACKMESAYSAPSVDIDRTL